MKIGPVTFSFGRADKSPMARWFWTIDRPLLVMLMVLIGVGLIAVAAASPAGALRLSGGQVRFEPLFFLLVVGGVFGVVGGWGLVRLPDPMTRLHAPTKAATLGVGAVLVASWAKGLLQDSGRVLLDAEMDGPLTAQVREALAGFIDRTDRVLALLRGHADPHQAGADRVKARSRIALAKQHRAFLHAARHRMRNQPVDDRAAEAVEKRMRGKELVAIDVGRRGWLACRLRHQSCSISGSEVRPASPSRCVRQSWHLSSLLADIGNFIQPLKCLLFGLSMARSPTVPVTRAQG